jgi:FkbM family methyltransferase
MKRQIVKGLADLAERAGYSILPTWRMVNRDFAEKLAVLLKHFEVDCVIDIGANDGGYGKFLRLEVGFTGLILSFEPVSAQAARCRAAAIQDPNWHVFAFALGNEECETEINVSSHSTFTSLLPAVESPPEAMTDLMSVSHREVVVVHRLDGVLPDLQHRHGFKRPYLKTDTQGFDLAVFDGAGDLLATMVGVQTELSFRPLYQGMPGWRTVLDILESRHFSVSNMFLVNHDASLRAVEFDCILMNERFATRS